VAVARKKETRFIHSGIKNCGSKGVHTHIPSGMPAIPEVNVLTRPEQRYRDISKLKQGDYREAWQSDAPASGGDFAEKIPPQRHRDTEEKHSAFGIQHSAEPNDRFAQIHTDKAEETVRRGSMRMGADGKAEVRNQKSEFESGDWLFHSGRTSPPTLRAQFSRIEQALKVTDLLLQSGGFGLIALDLGNISTRAARRVPLTSWFRFRRAVENTPTVLLVLERDAHARSCASLVLEMRHSASIQPSTKPSHAELLTGLGTRVEIARGERKGVASVRAEFTSKSAWSA
jgi:hypothetical protein